MESSIIDGNMGNLNNSRIVQGKPGFKEPITTCAVMDRRYYALFGLTMCVALVIWFGIARADQRNDRVVAVGDNGIQVTQADIEKLKKHFVGEKGISSTPEHYRNLALQLQLFLEEAKALGLDIKTEKATAAEMSMPELLRVMIIYLEEFAKDYPVDPLAIVSYYRANPDEFVGPLDDELKHTIRIKILREIREKIKEDAFERLKEKYHVHLVGAME